MKKKYVKFQKIDFIHFFILIFALIICFRLFNLQILQHKYYYALAFNQHEIIKKLIPERGKIFVKEEYSQNLFPLATNQILYLLYAAPREIEKPEIAAKELANILIQQAKTDEKPLKEKLKKEILEKLTRNPYDPYEPLKNKLTKEQAEKIEKLNLKGIYLREETWRYYPEKKLASHILGFVGFEKDERIGRYGLEKYFEKILKGEEGKFVGEKDPFGRIIPFGKKFLNEAEDGADLILTIDRIVQYITEKKLQEQIEKHQADSGSAIVLNSQTGEILAMASYPNFDPNQYFEEEKTEIFNNPNISYCYEPGSIFKIITFAAGLEEREISPETTYLDEGFVKIGPHLIKNAADKVYGKQTMTEVLENSINTGAIFVVKKIEDKFYQYLKKFGFDQQTEISLPSEAKGDIQGLKQNKEIYSATASFGQGICVTPLQMIRAIGAIANNGEMTKPYLVSEIRYKNGKIEKINPEKKRIISERTARTLSGMMVSVVENGHGKKAKVPGYWVAGKTGTAQVPKKEGRGYEEKKTIGSFAGFLPANDPKFVILVKIDNPKNVIWAETSAAPLFQEIAKFLVDYYKIEPSK